VPGSAAGAALPGLIFAQSALRASLHLHLPMELAFPPRATSPKGARILCLRSVLLRAASSALPPLPRQPGRLLPPAALQLSSSHPLWPLQLPPFLALSSNSPKAQQSAAHFPSLPLLRCLSFTQPHSLPFPPAFSSWSLPPQSRPTPLTLTPAWRFGLILGTLVSEGPRRPRRKCAKEGPSAPNLHCACGLGHNQYSGKF
jgi:hypothetical protein